MSVLLKIDDIENTDFTSFLNCYRCRPLTTFKNPKPDAKDNRMIYTDLKPKCKLNDIYMNDC